MLPIITAFERSPDGGMAMMREQLIADAPVQINRLLPVRYFT